MWSAWRFSRGRTGRARRSRHAAAGAPSTVVGETLDGQGRRDDAGPAGGSPALRTPDRQGLERRRTGRYWTDAAGPADFARVMQVRLAQSKIGRVVCPRPVIAEASLRSLGGP